jgi:carbamoyltransferase
MNDFYTLGINRHHNSSACLLRNGEIVYHIEEERFSGVKYDGFPFHCINESFKFTNRIDALVVAGFLPIMKCDTHLNCDIFSTIIAKQQKNYFPILKDYTKSHHLCHATCSFYNSGFDKAVIVVCDGSGSSSDDGIELHSIYYCEYPDKIKLLYTEKHNQENNNISVGWKFECINDYLGFHKMEAGKTMGLASYGKENSLIPDLNDNKYFELGFRFKEELLSMNYNKDFQLSADLAYKLQNVTQQKVLSLILKAVELSGCKNVCLSGGYGFNCVSNYFIKKNLPKDINLYVEPISGDAGTSIGAAKHFWHSMTKDMTIRKQKNIYYGFKYDETIDISQSERILNVTKKDIVDLLLEQNMVAIYQGRSESGPRALGNRTITFDPRNVNGKDIVNTMKKREHFRPFAGTILKEHAHEWFKMEGLDESPYMMYAVDVIEEKKKIIPSITHVDGTCRVQTVTIEENKHFYELISEFYNRTGVPILFNTSFNLAGNPLVETIDDALKTLRESNLKYLYLPEKSILVEKINL